MVTPVSSIPPSSTTDDGGVRVLKKSRSPRRIGAGTTIAAGILVMLGATAYHQLTTAETPPPSAALQTLSNTADSTGPQPAPSTFVATRAAFDDAHTEAPAARPLMVPNADPNDLASYIRPGDPEPKMAHVIAALREAGIRTGIAAFNPPGTSPPLEGLAVPADYVLPEGLVRHHQVSDEGVPIEPILMYSPDLVLRDAQGRVLPMPDNRVVPIERAPPGLPVRWVRPGKP